MSEAVTMDQWKTDVRALARAEVLAALGEMVKPQPMPISIAKALVQAQRAVKAVAHDGFNSFHKYRYTSAEALVAEARSALNGAGLALLEASFLMVGEGQMEVRYLLVHEDGSSWELESGRVPVIVDKGKSEDKAQAAARTYALGYAVRGLLLIPRPDEDHDVDQRDDRSREPQRQNSGHQGEARHEQRSSSGQQGAPNGNGGPRKFSDCATGEELLAMCERARPAVSKYQGDQRAGAIGAIRAAAERLKVPAERALAVAGVAAESEARADG